MQIADRFRAIFAPEGRRIVATSGGRAANETRGVRLRTGG